MTSCPRRWISGLAIVLTTGLSQAQTHVRTVTSFFQSDFFCHSLKNLKDSNVGSAEVARGFSSTTGSVIGFWPAARPRRSREIHLMRFWGMGN